MYLDVLFLPFSVHKVKCILPSFNVTQGHSFFHFTWTFLLLEGLDGPGGGSFDGPGDWFVISGETGSREGGGGVVLSPVSVFTSSEAPFLPLSDSAENSVCCPFSRWSRFFGGIRVCLNETVAWNSPPPILLITKQQGRTEHLIWFRLTNDYALYKHSELFGSFTLLNKATKVYRDVLGVLFSLSFYFNTRFVNTKGEFSLRHLFSLRRTVYKNNGTFSSPMRVWCMAHVLPNHCLPKSCKTIVHQSNMRNINQWWLLSDIYRKSDILNPGNR